MLTKSNNTTYQGTLDNRYLIINEIDNGMTSKVYKVLDEQTSEIKIAKIYENYSAHAFKKEKKIFKLLQALDISSNIKYYAAGTGELEYDDKKEKKMFSILEFGNKGNLFDVLFKTKNGFSEDVCEFILLLILNAIEALHKNGICHRDIKPENMVFIGDNYDLKLIDFGVACKFLNKYGQKKKLQRCVGSEYYCSPEILEGKPYDGDKADIFSIGALLFVLMTKNFAFYDATIDNNSFKIKKILYKIIQTKQYDKYWELLEKYFNIKNLSPNFKNLFLKMVAYNPEERPTIEEIRNDKFMSDIINASEEQLSLLRKKMINEIQC